MRIAAAILALAISIPASAADAPPPEPASHPDWAALGNKAAREMIDTLYDPSSAQFRWTKGFQWQGVKPYIGKRQYGWYACGTINARNRLGGYIGAQQFAIYVAPDGQPKWVVGGYLGENCGRLQTIAIQPGLTDIDMTAPDGTNPSVADELAKLAKLRDQGVITADEFTAQKAKLLAR